MPLYNPFASVEENAALAGTEQTFMELPMDCLPARIQETITAVSGAYQCPRDYCLAAMAAAAACLIGKRRWSTFGEHKNYATLWLAVVGDTASGKTAPLSWFFKPIQRHERDSHVEYMNEVAKYKANADMPRPQWRHRIINNPTDESVLQELAYNKDITWKADELRTIFDGFGQYKRTGGGTIVSNLLSIFNNEDVSVTRVSGENRYLEEPNLNIVGGIQPSTLARIMTKQSATEDGMFQRFLFVYPDRVPIPMWTDVVIPEQVSTAWNNVCAQLMALPYAGVGETPEAAAYHIETVNRWREDCNALYMDDPVRLSVVRKMEIHLCRLSLVLATVSYRDVIDIDVMRTAVEWCDYFLLTSLKVANFMQGGASEQLSVNKKNFFYMCAKLFPEVKVTKLAEAVGMDKSNVAKQIKEARK